MCNDLDVIILYSQKNYIILIAVSLYQYFKFEVIPLIIAVTPFIVPVPIDGQKVIPEIDRDVLSITQLTIDGQSQKPLGNLPLFSFFIDSNSVISSSFSYSKSVDTFLVNTDFLEIRVIPKQNSNSGWRTVIRIINRGNKDIKIHNLVPLGTNRDHVYITGFGNHYLSRSHLFLPDRDPINVILPDNAWELGFVSIPLSKLNMRLCGLSRRTSWHNDLAIRHRFSTVLQPQGFVEYTMYLEASEGSWQRDLKKIFQERMLFDLNQPFDDHLYRRPDLKWIRGAVVGHLLMAWDRWFYDSGSQNYQLEEFILKGQTWYGGDDFIGIWPTWPTLGLDQRNQWDLYRSLPGGLSKLSEVFSTAQRLGSKIFISYNPWDQSTRKEDHLRGMAHLIKELQVDGVILDTRGESSREIQLTADQVKPGVIMYSEGMAVPKNMETILAGRVHNALYYPPILNLNRLIRPEFSIFRVAELYREPIKREYNLCLLNGHGVELNVFRPGRPNWIEENYRYLGKIARILRLGNENFHHTSWIPCLDVHVDKLLVNFWPGTHIPQLYTIYSQEPKGMEASFFPEPIMQNIHYVDLWKYLELDWNPEEKITLNIDPFAAEDVGTNNEGSVSTVAGFIPHLNIEEGGPMQLRIKGQTGNRIKIWPGNPAYNQDPRIFDSLGLVINPSQLFPRYFGKLVIELYQGQRLIDVRIWHPSRYDLPVLIPQVEKTVPPNSVPDRMKFIPPGVFKKAVSQGDEFIPYPLEDTLQEISFSGFYMDIHPVTNLQYYEFLVHSGYQPQDTSFFLKHWIKGKFPNGQAHYPVVYVAYEDAKAYCKWAGKRLPTQWEWQYAAQAGDNRKWPWSNQQPTDKEKQFITETLTFEKITGIDSNYCNLGNGIPDPVGKYPSGKNPWGLEDLVGSVWQMTNDLYDNGSYRFIMLKGGSYYKPGSSWWYVQGGPRELSYRQMLLRVSPGFERNATIGFRCVKDK